MRIENRVKSIEKALQETGDREKVIFRLYVDGPPPMLPDGTLDHEKITGGKPCRYLFVSNLYGKADMQDNLAV